jgi:hypothetical protein
MAANSIEEWLYAYRAIAQLNAFETYEELRCEEVVCEDPTLQSLVLELGLDSCSYGPEYAGRVRRRSMREANWTRNATVTM